MVSFARPRLRGVVPVAAALLLAGLMGSTAITPATTVATMSYRATSIADQEAQFSDSVLRIVNQKRASHGLRKVRRNACVNGFSEDWAGNLARRNAFEHSNLYRLLDRCDAVYASENIARIPTGVSPRHLVRLWMHSPDHRHNILSSKPRVSGVAVRWDADEQAWLAVQNFARR
jgi:uncharacterized protein YkwD